MTGTFTGDYVRLGEMVFASAVIALTAKGSSTGNAVLGGLPFNVNATLGAGGGIMHFYGSMSGMSAVLYDTQGGNATVKLGFFGATGTTQLTDANFANNSLFAVTIIYRRA